METIFVVCFFRGIFSFLVRMPHNNTTINVRNQWFSRPATSSFVQFPQYFKDIPLIRLRYAKFSANRSL